jgi:hypothetical protein
MKRRMIRVRVTGMPYLAVVLGPGLSRSIPHGGVGDVPAEDENVVALLKAGRITKVEVEVKAKAEGKGSDGETTAKDAKGKVERGNGKVAEKPKNGKSHHKGAK